MINFRNFEIWNNAIRLAKDIYLHTSQLAITEKYGLISKMQRGAVSISSNAA
ncbi:MAG: four helix bundle protein [Bacteroidales bacterium]